MSAVHVVRTPEARFADLPGYGYAKAPREEVAPGFAWLPVRDIAADLAGPARLADGTLGFNLVVGGGLSDGPRMASPMYQCAPPTRWTRRGE